MSEPQVTVHNSILGAFLGMIIGAFLGGFLFTFLIVAYINYNQLSPGFGNYGGLAVIAAAVWGALMGGVLCGAVCGLPFNKYQGAFWGGIFSLGINLFFFGNALIFQFLTTLPIFICAVILCSFISFITVAIIRDGLKIGLGMEENLSLKQ